MTTVTHLSLFPAKGGSLTEALYSTEVRYSRSDFFGNEATNSFR